MKDFCFYTCFDDVYKETGQGMVKSVKKFYPDAPIFVFAVPRNGDFNLRDFCDFHLQRGAELLKEYKRVISVDSDHIMCAECPDLFGDFDLGVVQNNIPVASHHGGIDRKIYINAGLSVCTCSTIWEVWTKEYEKRCNERWDTLNEQNALNHIYHTSPYFNMKLLEFKDRVYGISSMFSYEDMYIKNDELYTADGKKLCLFHAAGVEWKKDGIINFDLVRDEQARNKLRSMTC